jgi:NADH:ubiquinone oxidoreductase subunit E
MTVAPDTDNWPAVEAEAKAALTPEIVAFLEQSRQLPHSEGQLIAVLHKVQAHFGYIGREHMDAVSQLLGVPTSRVTGVATFYHFFRLQPSGRFMINVCMGTACYVKGADRVAAKIREELGIDFGETTTDGQFSLDSAACVGTCGLAPVVMINDQVFPHVTPDQVPALLEKIQAGATDK